MIRRALIIYCDDVQGLKVLPGPPYDNANYRAFLQSKLGGEWLKDEIRSLKNPDSKEVRRMVNTFMADADYTFTIYTGHGHIDVEDNKKQYVYLSDKAISIDDIITNAERQTMIIDACRDYYIHEKKTVRLFCSALEESAQPSISTRRIFDKNVLSSAKGLSILYAASENESAKDSTRGAAYLLSLLKAANLWKKSDTEYESLSIRQAHNFASTFIRKDFLTIQVPAMEPEKRGKYFPFAVKVIPLR
jgi:hypothetical protein